MDYLVEMTKEEYINSDIEYPVIVLVTDENYLRWTAPVGYKTLDTYDMFTCSDGDFLVKE